MDRETLFIVTRNLVHSAIYVFRTRLPARAFAKKKNAHLRMDTAYRYVVQKATWGPDNVSPEPKKE